MIIAQNIKERRLKLGMTQQALAEALGVSRPLVAQYERGTKVPTLPLAVSLAEVLGCRLEDLTAERNEQ